MSWREIAQEHLWAATEKVPPDLNDPKAIRRLLNAAYPFGERSRFPYKMWLEEIRRVCHLIRPKLFPHYNQKPKRRPANGDATDNQLDLFERKETPNVH